MTEHAVELSVHEVDPETAGETLRSVLEPYHGWLAHTAADATETDGEDPDADGEGGPNTDVADAAAGDITELRNDERWAFVGCVDGDPAGVVLLYGMSERLAELERLFVVPDERGAGLGRALCEAAIERANEKGYERVGLTTPPWSEPAHAIYEALGFVYTDPYPETMLPERLHEGALFMQRETDSIDEPAAGR
jgi:GNAT superfamily N-acetyltransferase